MLRLVFDQHAGGELYNRLATNEAIDIERVRNIESLGSKADDTDIWRYAVENGRVVVTNDEDFIDGSADPDDSTHPGVIIYDNYQWAGIARAVERIEQVMGTEEMTGVVLHVPTGWVD